jgi:hypothetical protein
MKICLSSLPVVGAMVAALTLVANSPIRADSIYTFSMSTQPFANLVATSDPSAPFSLYFYLNSSGGPSNTVTLSDFNFGAGGSAVPATTFTYGDVTGDASSSIVLNDNPINSTLNGLIEQFTPGPTLSFQIDTTLNSSNAAPDQFGFAILDSSFSNVVTTDSVNDNFLTITLTASQTSQLNDIDGADGIGSAGPITLTPAASAVPLPPVWELVLALLPPVWMFRVRWRRWLRGC